MKRFFLFMALTVSYGWLSMPCQAQTLEGAIRDFFAPLDKSEVQTGILIDQSALFAKPGNFDGNNIHLGVPLHSFVLGCARTTEQKIKSRLLSSKIHLFLFLL